MDAVGTIGFARHNSQVLFQPGTKKPNSIQMEGDEARMYIEKFSKRNKNRPKSKRQKAKGKNQKDLGFKNYNLLEVLKVIEVKMWQIETFFFSSSSAKGISIGPLNPAKNNGHCWTHD